MPTAATSRSNINRQYRKRLHVSVGCAFVCYCGMFSPPSNPSQTHTMWATCSSFRTFAFSRTFPSLSNRNTTWKNQLTLRKYCAFNKHGPILCDFIGEGLLLWCLHLPISYIRVYAWLSCAQSLFWRITWTFFKFVFMMSVCRKLATTACTHAFIGGFLVEMAWVGSDPTELFMQ